MYMSDRGTCDSKLEHTHKPARRAKVVAATTSLQIHSLASESLLLFCEHDAVYRVGGKQATYLIGKIIITIL